MKKLVLIGAGHSHLFFLKKLSHIDRQNYDIQLISDANTSYYSALVPGFIVGTTEQKEVEVSVINLCKALNISFHLGVLTSVNPRENSIQLSSGQILYYDVLSINTGSAYRKIPTDSESNDRVIYLKPWSDFFPQWKKLLEQAQKSKKLSISIIGGGVGSVEIALSVKARLTQLQIENKITLITSGDHILQDSANSLSLKISKILAKSNIELYLQKKITSIKNQTPMTSDSVPTQSFDYILVATNPSPPESLKNLNLKLDKDGFVRVNYSLQSYENIFVSGDAASFDSPIAKSGVHAVRQGEVLSYNLISRMDENTALKEYFPPRRTLSILTTGLSTACLSWGNFTICGYWPWLLKRYIDKKYMNSFVGKYLKST